MNKKILTLLFVSVVIFSLICPVNLSAKKEKRGAKIIITKDDGKVVEGRLLKVNKDSLVLLTTPTNDIATKSTIGIEKIDKIRIKKKSKVLIGAGIGLVVGGIVGYVGFKDATWAMGAENGAAEAGFLLGAIPGALLGAGIGGAGFSGYIKIQVKGKSPSQIEKVLKKLKKRARFKD